MKHLTPNRVDDAEGVSTRRREGIAVSKLNPPELRYRAVQALQRKRINMKESEIAGVMRDSLEATGYLHDMGRIHRCSLMYSYYAGLYFIW